jgi:hypothetical protein
MNVVESGRGARPPGSTSVLLAYGEVGLGVPGYRDGLG